MKIVVAGQMDKQSIARLVEKLAGDKAEVSIKSDLDGTLAIQSGKADYYLGACSTGAGGALGLAMGLLGTDKVVSVSTPAKVMNQEEISNEVKNGKVAFGFVNYDAEKVVPLILNAIFNKEE